MTQVLSNVCLCAIVKNEKENCLGGISTYLDGIQPHVGLAVIVDTGSTDGTLEVQKDYMSRYPYLHVFEAPFGTFSRARNLSLFLSHWVIHSTNSMVTRLMFLDADERFNEENLALLSEVVKTQDALYSDLSTCFLQGSCIKFGLVNVDHTGTPVPRMNAGLMNPRIIPVCKWLLQNNLSQEKLSLHDLEYNPYVYVNSIIESVLYKNTNISMTSCMLYNGGNTNGPNIINTMQFIDEVQSKRFERVVQMTYNYSDNTNTLTYTSLAKETYFTCPIPPVFFHYVPSTAQRKIKNRQYQGEVQATELKKKRVEDSEKSNIHSICSTRARWAAWRVWQRVCVREDMAQEKGMELLKKNQVTSEMIRKSILSMLKQDQLYYSLLTSISLPCVIHTSIQDITWIEELACIGILHGNKQVQCIDICGGKELDGLTRILAQEQTQKQHSSKVQTEDKTHKVQYQDEEVYIYNNTQVSTKTYICVNIDGTYVCKGYLQPGNTSIQPCTCEMTTVNDAHNVYHAYQLPQDLCKEYNQPRTHKRIWNTQSQGQSKFAAQEQGLISQITTASPGNHFTHAYARLTDTSSGLYFVCDARILYVFEYNNK